MEKVENTKISEKSEQLEQSDCLLGGDKAKKQKNTWINPFDNFSSNQQIFRTGLLLKNSLTNKKNEFITKDGSKNITWYSCGPTVYDVSHLGHARTYLSFDILKRIFESYFGYNVYLTMNITDIDDKIIKKVVEQGCSLSDVTKKYEDLFFEDMKRLNVQYPNQITRVTEYVPEIIQFIEKLISNNFAYESNGSVYFEIDSFTKDFQYAKLDPTKLGSEKPSEEENKEKKGKYDFVLWKNAKENEPFWISPWGKGRPGWHIECSVMCTQIFGDKLDVHSGGCDLKFPHHDNEIAQTEAFYKSKQWINYFLHTGHLHIDGSKMSKSLKNFIKISDVLDEGFNTNSFRIQFLKHKWDTEMDYNRDGLRSAWDEDKKLKEFFFKLKEILRSTNTKVDMKFNENDKFLDSKLRDCQDKVHKNLIDNINTEEAFKELKELINNFFIYEKKAKGSLFKIQLGYSVGRYLAFMMKCFGLDYNVSYLENFNFESEGERLIKNEVVPVISLRDSIRKKIPAKQFKEIVSETEAFELSNPNSNTLILNFAKNLKIKAIEENMKELFKESDKFRDEILPQLGIRLKDEGDSSIWEYVDPQILKQETELDRKLIIEREEEKRKEEEEKQRKVAFLF